ncbi:MAG: hypothetical protein U0271_00650 [Polyangiaceae bacterium]
MSILDLLFHETPFGTSDAAVLNQLAHQTRLAARRPWESGVSTPVANAVSDVDRQQADEIDRLENRVAALEMAVKFLCETLARSGQIDQAKLAEQIAAVVAEVEHRRSEEEPLVTCANCKARVPAGSSYRRATGTLCETCHHGNRRPPREMVSKETTVGAAYRAGSQTQLVEATDVCASCGVEVPRSKALLSGRGPLCPQCHAALEE